MAVARNPKFLWLALAALVLASANFIAVLDMTIANVSVAAIAGGLGTSTSQGTWVITSYAVAEAITVPLTGWLASRFGAVRVFVTAMALFGVFSALCGLSTSLGMLVAARGVALTLSGGLPIAGLPRGSRAADRPSGRRQRRRRSAAQSDIRAAAPSSPAPCPKFRPAAADGAAVHACAVRSGPRAAGPVSVTP